MSRPLSDGAPAAGGDALARPERLAALRRSELLDTPPEAAFDRLTRLAATILHVPVSLVSLVDVNRQFFKSAVGLPEPWASRRETPLSHSFCQHVVAGAAPLVVDDAREHPVLHANAAIDDIGVVAYAGFPIVADDGEVLGSFCAIDTAPHTWTEGELAILRELTSLARTEIELRAALREADRAARAAEQASAERTAVIESSSDGIYTVDLSGRCTLANSAAAAILGFPREELVGANMHDLVHHHHADGTPFPEAECPLYRAFRDGRPVRLDTAMWRRDGSAFPADCASSPLFVDGRLAGAVVTFRDVSERVAAAAALRESERKFRAIFEDAGVGIVITALDGRLLDCNEAYERITGRGRAELHDTMFDAVTHPDDVAEQRRLGESLVAGEREQFGMEKRYIRRDGGEVWARLSVTLVRGADDAPRFLVAVVEDVTAERRAADAMRLLADAGAVLAGSLEYEDTLRRVARLALPMLGEACLIDVRRPDGSVETIAVHLDVGRERAPGELHGARPAAARPAPVPDPAPAPAPAPAPDATEVLTDLAAAPAFADLHALGLRALVRTPLRGVERPLGALTFASRRHGYLPSDVRLVEELAARAAAAIENALLYREARSATRARDEVLAVVSHDLRNPVHTITMSSSFLLDAGPVDAETTRVQLGVIRRSAERADRLIRDLLDVARIEHGQLRLERQPLAAGELLAEAAQLAAPKAEARALFLSVAVECDGLTVFADRHRVLQALDNLLGNALKFTPSGGRVVLAAAPDPDGVRFEVRDSGPGVAAADQGNLFRPFWQARRADRRGVGLGLSIVKGIVDAHGGRVAVESDGRTGTAIRFTIPHAAPVAAPAAAAAAAGGAA